MQKDKVLKWIDITGDIGGNIVTFIIKPSFKPKIEEVSKNIVNLVGYTREEFISDEILIFDIIDRTELKKVVYKLHKFFLSSKKEKTISCNILTKDGKIKVFEIFLLKSIDDLDKTIKFIGYATDITQKVQFQKEIDFLKTHDVLTSLINRESLKKIMKEEIESLKKSKKNQVALFLYLDLDGFTKINESYGQIVADKLLIHISHRLRSCIKKEDIVARIGDDAFAILLPKLNNLTYKSHVNIVAKRVSNIIKKPFLIDDNLIYTKVSIGVSVMLDDGQSVEEIIKNSLLAMKRAKKEQNRVFCYFEKKMHKRSILKNQMENEINGALANNEFELYYQPQVDVKTQIIVGAEALIRWNHPKKGFISPFEFIPIAEESDLIVKIGEWVLKRACQDIKDIFREKNIPESFKKVSINISPKQFSSPTFTVDIMDIIDKYEIDPAYIELELTEGALISNTDDTIEKMIILKEFGITFSIDDFGTGYSSLSYLKKLPVDIIKIDKSFISNMHEDSDDRILTQTIIEMSKNLRLHIIAEGVEKVEHLNFLQDRGCQVYQGYLFSKPIRFVEFKKLLLSSQKVKSLT